MDDRELNRRLKAADPARPTPASLTGVIDNLVARPIVRRHRGLRVAAFGGGALVLVGGLTAFTDLDTFLLSVPPFSALDDGTVRTAEGLPYVPVGETDRGEECAIWVDFGGISHEQMASINSYWSAVAPEAFAHRVNERLGELPVTDDAEGLAKRQQLRDDFSQVVPGMTWGTAPHGKSWAEGQPHMTSFFTVCSDDLDALS